MTSNLVAAKCKKKHTKLIGPGLLCIGKITFAFCKGFCWCFCLSFMVDKELNTHRAFTRLNLASCMLKASSQYLALLLVFNFPTNAKVLWQIRCCDANLIEIPVEVETPDRHYYHVWNLSYLLFS